ncbi:uncharacterized protein MONBRDRAFT_32192, partial [Monosiga brevicollis MX1]
MAAAQVELGLGLVLAIYLGCLVASVYDEDVTGGPNTCSMYYMHPSYARITPDALKDIHPRYELTRYTDGHERRLVRTKKPEAVVPVLFVPGNAGDYRQVRSFGTELQKQARAMNDTELAFAVFATDFQEELSALSPAIFTRQRLLNSLEVPHLQPYSRFYGSHIVALVLAHSTGGVVVAHCLAHDRDLARWVALQVNLGSALEGPVVALSPQQAPLYRELQAWLMDDTRSTVVLNVGGGPRDLLVRDDLVFPREELVEQRELFLAVSTASMPDVGRSVDHLCLLWCREVVTKVANAVASALADTPSPGAIDGTLRRRLPFAHKLEPPEVMALLADEGLRFTDVAISQRRKPIASFVLQASQCALIELKSEGSFEGCELQWVSPITGRGGDLSQRDGIVCGALDQSLIMVSAKCRGLREVDVTVQHHFLATVLW